VEARGHEDHVGAMIVRDEAAVLEDCLRSIEPAVDEIVVVDTASVRHSSRAGGGGQAVPARP
jgi:hypothetical protein